jgi:hypothetical protein
LRALALGIRCLEENKIISSSIEEDGWISIRNVLLRLTGRENCELLFSWKDRKSIATAKEVYAWRRAIDVIKEHDLAKELGPVTRDSPALMKSRPIMLKIAGEITTALMHSYDNRHRIFVIQSSSTVPS